jgi:hypothetical protein
MKRVRGTQVVQAEDPSPVRRLYRQSATAAHSADQAARNGDAELAERLRNRSSALFHQGNDLSRSQRGAS